MTSKKIRVLHLPTTTGGNPQSIAKSERKLGLDSWAMSLHNKFKYSSDETLCENCSLVICELKRLLFYFRLFFRYDIIHYNFGSTLAAMVKPPNPKSAFSFMKIVHWCFYYYSDLLRFFELNILNLMNKPIFVTYQGSDARQGDYCSKFFEISFVKEVGDDFFYPIKDEKKRKYISLLNRYAHRIYSVNPDLLHVLPERTEFIPYAHVDMKEWKPVYITNPKIKIIHAPSHRGIKGTKYVLDAVNKLRKSGYDFDFELIEGLPNQIARTHYEQADLLIDQLFAGWYGGLAVELMALGKPVICYIREKDLKFIPREMRDEIPIIQATSETLQEILKIWITKPREELVSLGKLSRIYVEKWHDSREIANRLKQDYEKSLWEIEESISSKDNTHKY